MLLEHKWCMDDIHFKLHFFSRFLNTMIASVIVLLSCEWQSQMNKRRPPLISTQFVFLFYCLLRLKKNFCKYFSCWHKNIFSLIKRFLKTLLA